MQSVSFLIDALKARVPIWKKEVYDEGETWKENPEFDRLKLADKSD